MIPHTITTTTYTLKMERNIKCTYGFLFLLLLPALHGFTVSSFRSAALFDTNQGLLQRRTVSTLLQSVISVKTGKDGKPAASPDQDLELTRSIIMAHQDKFSDANAPSTSELSTRVVPLSTDTPSLLIQPGSRVRTTRPIWILLGLATAAAAASLPLSRPPVLSVFITQLPTWIQQGPLKSLWK
jgi:hypothetical protein